MDDLGVKIQKPIIFGKHHPFLAILFLQPEKPPLPGWRTLFFFGSQDPSMKSNSEAPFLISDSPKKMRCAHQKAMMILTCLPSSLKFAP